MTDDLTVITTPVYFINGWYGDASDSDWKCTPYVSDLDLSRKYIITVSNFDYTQHPGFLDYRLKEYRFFNSGIGLGDTSNQVVLDVPLYGRINSIRDLIESGYVQGFATCLYSGTYFESPSGAIAIPEKYKRVSIIPEAH